MIPYPRAAAGVLAITLAGLAPAPAPAQNTPSNQNQSDYRQTIARATATRLTRSAVIMTRTFNDPAIEEFQIGALALSIAQRLDPNNEELLRLQIEAWRHARNDTKVLELTRKLVKLNPADTTAQLKIITENMSSLQRIEDRITTYEKLLANDTGTLDASVRSRLAFDAALLHRELGNNPAFFDLLQQAIKLDQTNKPAILLASTLFFERVDDPPSRAKMYTQLILADPLDPAAHQAFATELLRHGAFSGADRFLKTGATLRLKRGITTDEELLNLYHTIRWGVDGATSYLEQLAEEEASARYTADINRRALEEAGEDTSTLPQYTASPVEDRTRAIMSSAIAEPEAALYFYDRMETSIAASVQASKDAGRLTPAQEAEYTERLTAESIRLRTWMGIDLLGAERALESLRASDGLKIRQSAVDRYQGLLAAHRADAESARTLLTPLAENDDLLSILGLAIAAQNTGNAREAAAHYATVVKAAPGSVEGLWARERLTRMLGSTINPAKTATQLNTIAANAPAQLERIIRNPAEHLRLSVKLRDQALQPLGELYADLELKNVGIFPLAIGNNAPVASRVVVSPMLTIGGVPVNTMLNPEFASFARKIRLQPGESVRASVWLGAGPAGVILEGTTPLASSLRVQAVHGYVYAEEGGVYNPDSFSLEAGSDIIWHRPQRPSPPFEDILERFNTAVGPELPIAMLEAQWFLAKSAQTEELTQELNAQKEQLINAIAARYPSMTPIEQAFTLLGVPGAWQLEQAAALDETALAAELSPYTALALLLTRVTGADSPALDAALKETDPQVREIAEIMALRFEIIERAQKVREAIEATPGARNQNR